MEQKTYGLDSLAFICAGRTNATNEAAWVKAIHTALLPMYEGEDERAIYRVRDGGLWRNCEMRVAVGAPSGERDVLEWQPIADPKKPALPIPFTAGEFAAFTLAGRGTMVIERFEDEDDEDALSDLELAKLGLYGDEAREVLREANRLRLEASRRFRRNVAKPEEPPLLQLDDEGTKNAVAWLLNGAEPAPAGDAAVERPPTLTKPQIVDAFEGIDGPPAPAKPATPDPVTAQDSAVVGAVPGWDLNRLERFPGYRRPLFNYLKIEHVAGKKCPTARDVLDAWTQTKPLGIARVLADGIDYLDANGEEHPAPLRAIQQAINGMVTKT